MSVATSELEILEFSLGEARYCVTLDRVEEIVHANATLTPSPNARREVAGVMDLRGAATTVIDPVVALGIRREPSNWESKKVIVFSAESGSAAGWMVDEVRRATTVPEERIDRSVAGDGVKGMLKIDERFAIWVEPGSAGGCDALDE